MGGGGGADVGGSSKGRGGGAGGISVRADGAITSCNHRTPASGKEWPISRRCTAMCAVSRPSFCMEDDGTETKSLSCVARAEGGPFGREHFWSLIFVQSVGRE